MSGVPNLPESVDRTAKTATGSQSSSEDRSIDNFRPLKVIVIGAGYSGLNCGIRIPQRLKNVELTIYEKNNSVGGTWYENKYPGCACDVPAHSYQLSYCPNPRWKSFYATGPEIYDYLKSVAEKYEVGRFVKLNHIVQSCDWDEESSKW